MYPILFQFGPFTIYSFGTLMALAALSAGWIVCLELQRNRYNPELASTLIFAAAIGGLLGARVLFLFEEWESFVRSPWDFIFSGAGFTWYGGMLGGISGWTKTMCIYRLSRRNATGPSLVMLTSILA